MKYEGKKLSGNGNIVFSCFFGTQELEMLTSFAYNGLKNTPKTTENQIYRARLKTLSEQLYDIYSQEVKNKNVQTKNHWE